MLFVIKKRKPMDLICRCKRSKFAFSLVELMLSLIIISLIAAAFTPVITKKLKTSSVMAGLSNISVNCSEKFGDDCKACTEDICLSCKKTCNSDEILDNDTCSCGVCGNGICKIGGLYVTQYNLGDNTLQIPSSAHVNVVNAGVSCGAVNDTTTRCCWKSISTDGECDSANGSYSGCERTVCNWAAANAICANYNAKGLSWRLPTTSELENWPNYSLYKKDSGLMLCDRMQGKGSSYCRNNEGCNMAGLERSCYLVDVHSQNLINSTSEYYYNLQNGGWYKFSDANNGALWYGRSVRCVASITDIPNCKTYSSDGESCEQCKSGYKLSNDGTCESDFYYYLNDNGLMITKYNMGDNDYTKISDSAGVTIVNTNENCGSSTDFNSKCCWQGATSTSCDSANGSYSGCERTVCNWAAANAICANYNQDGRTWRLPTTDELASWKDYSVNKSNDGLMLCDYVSGHSSAQCDYSQECLGSYDNKCYPYNEWSKNTKNSSNMYYYFLSTGGWYGPDDYFGTSAKSVRCVAEYIPHCKNHTAYQGKFTCSTCENGYYVGYYGLSCDKSTEVENCETYSQSKDACSTCKNGFKLLDGKCVDNYYVTYDGLRITKYNMGDTTETAIPSAAGVVRTATGSSCTSEKCCWYGNTSSICNSDNGGYSGCNRTVCNWEAANAICANYKQDGKTWRLPTTTEIASWNTYTLGLGLSGLMLCSSGVSTDIARCDDYINCPGSYSNYCSGRNLWSQETDSTTGKSAYFYLHTGEIMGPYWYDKTNSYAVRCVTPE